MKALVPIALFGWLPLVLGLFMLLPARRAVIVSFLIAWLFLPIAGYQFAGLPDYTKMSATCLGVLLGAAIFDSDRLLSFRFSWVDLPIAFYCLSPLFASLSNDLGLYDGVSTAVRYAVTWALPYLIGRVYFSDLEAVRELAIGMVIGGLIYIPFCWVEFVMSPQLHRWVYGRHQHAFAQTIRFGGFRPMVFMQHGLMVAMWMSLTAMIGVWLVYSRSFRTLWGVPTVLLVIPLAFTALLCKSSYAIMLFAAGVAALVISQLARTRLVVIALILTAPVFIGLRATLAVDGGSIVDFATRTFGPERAQSLNFRFDNENRLSEHALDRPVFGWGGWNRSRPDHMGTDDRGTTVDSLWIIQLGTTGVVGVVALCLMLLTPMILTMGDYQPGMWAHPRVAPVVALSMLLVVYMLDHLMNAMVNPIFMLACGAVMSAHLWAAWQRRLAEGYPARRRGGGSPAAGASRRRPGLAVGLRGPQTV
jgi:hypothetical protein